MFTRQDLPLHISSSEIDLYAGDTIITSSADCNSMVRLQESLNTSVSEILTGHWPIGFHSIRKRLKVQLVKGKRLWTKINNNPEITCNGSLLTNVMNVTLLGLEIDEEISFSEHVNTLCKNLTQHIGLLRKITNYLPLKQRLLQNNGLIMPVINHLSFLSTDCDKQS